MFVLVLLRYILLCFELVYLPFTKFDCRDAIVICVFLTELYILSAKTCSWL